MKIKITIKSKSIADRMFAKWRKQSHDFHRAVRNGDVDALKDMAARFDAPVKL